MGEQLASALDDELPLRRGNGSASMDHRALGPHPARVERDGPDEVHLDLDCRVALSHRKSRVDRDAHRRVQEGHRPTAVHHANRVVEIFGRLAHENRLSLSELGAREIHRGGDRWRRQTAVGDLPQQLETCLPRRIAHDLKGVFPCEGPRPVGRLGVHIYPLNADTTATIPRATIARPLNTLIPRTTASVIRWRKKDTPNARQTHHAADPSSTPKRTTAGLAKEPVVPSPSDAASAANEMIVAGLVMVTPTVER